MLLLLILALLAACGTSVRSLAQEGFNAIEAVRLYNAIDEVGSHPVTLDVNVTEFAGRDAWVKVTWSGVRHPSFDDWVGVFAPAYASVRDSTPIKYKLATVSATHYEEGQGSITFLLENHRESMRIGFFFNGFDSPHLVAHSPTIICKDVNMPLHGRITLTGDNTEAVVQWTTHDTAGGIVQLGRRSGKYTDEFAASDITYDRTDMCGGAAKHEGWIDPGVFHYTLLTGLAPGHRYYYRFGAEATGFSKEFSFLAAPPVGPDTHVKVIALADMGQVEPDGANEQSEMVPSGNTSRLMLAEVAKGGYSLVGHYGDISYARGHVSQWDRFHAQMEPLIANVPYMIGIGNHERDWPDSGCKLEGDDSGGECGVAHERRFLMPSLRQDQPWFSFEHGPIHYVHVSTEHYFHRGSEQHHFVKRALAAVDRRRTPWLIVTGHRPIYIDSTETEGPNGDQYVATALREAFEELYTAHGVDLTLHGHHHDYQRTCPVYKGKCVGYHDDGTARGTVHVVIGNAGASLSFNQNEHKPEVFEKVHVWWGFSRIHASGTHLKMDSISDADGKVFDTLKLSKPKHWGKHWHHKHGEPHSRTMRPKYWWEHDGIETPPQVLAYQQAQMRRRSRASA